MNKFDIFADNDSWNDDDGDYASKDLEVSPDELDLEEEDEEEE